LTAPPATWPAPKTASAAPHAPPFREATWHEGQPSDDNHLPFFACTAVGDVVLKAAQAHPDRQIVVLCGHTHGDDKGQVLKNLRVLTGPSEYGKPGGDRGLAVE